MNKLDRPSRDPLELLDELESVLGIGAFPMNWPLGSGDRFQRRLRPPHADVHCFERAAHGATRAPVSVTERRTAARRARERTGLRAVPRGDRAARRRRREFRSGRDAAGKTTPVFFGSAVTNFGVQLFLDAFVRWRRPPASLAAASLRTIPRSPVSSSRFKRTWIRATATEWPSCAFARASSRAT